MPVKQKLEKLASEHSAPCVTISLNTHRTHPDNEQDRVLLKNLLKEAKERVESEFDKRAVQSLVKKISDVEQEVDIQHNLDSLHIYLSNDTKEIIKSIWPVHDNAVHLSDHFAVRPLIKTISQAEEYFILLLSQGGAHLYEAMNDTLLSEVRNNDFPFSETTHHVKDAGKASDPKQVDNMVREYFNKIDKALIRVIQESGLHCLVISTGDNYSRLIQVADRPGVYQGHVQVDYSRVSPHDLVKQGWEFVKTSLQERKAEAIHEMQEAVSKSRVLTDLQEIYRAAIDGKGDLLLINQDFSQPVLMKGDRNFELISDATLPDAVDDITSSIANEVLSKKGRVLFIGKDQLEELGDIALKTRY